MPEANISVTNTAYLENTSIICLQWREFQLLEIQSDEKFGLRTKFNASVGYQYPDIKDGPVID